MAQEASTAPPPAPSGTPDALAAGAQPSTNAMVNLIRLLVQQGTITRENGAALLRQAEAEAAQARVASGALAPPPPGAERVPYVPEAVRNQIRDEIKGEVMKQAQAEGWAAPNKQAPAWVNNIHLNADMRLRGEFDGFSSDNANDLIDYAAINNTAGGFDFFKNANNVPIVNTTHNRQRERLRLRVGAELDVSPEVTVGFRLATGDDNGPISTNQLLGGGLGKKNIWVDQAYLRLTTDRLTGGRLRSNAWFGRFKNPFTSTDLVFDRDLNLDGGLLTFQENLPHTDNSLTLRGGAFPLDFGSFDRPSTLTAKVSNRTKWLLGGQLEVGAKVEGAKVNLAAAYYDFRNVQGQLSAPCLFNGRTVGIGTNDPVECSTDESRAFFARKGNTLFFIRNIVVPAPDTLPASNRQFLGLTYKYALLDLNTSVSVPVAGVDATLLGDYVRNLAFKHSDECRYGVGPNGIPFTNVTAVNGNENPCSAASPAKVESGNEGFLVRLTVGNRAPHQWGEWNVLADYRYLESDAVLDSLTDSDFHLGGTNTKGYSIGATLGLLNGMNLTGRWMSANEISGRPLRIDVLQLELIGEF